MSDTKFTPGPWYLCDLGDYGDFGGYSRVILSEPLSDDDPYRLAVVHTGGVLDEMREANAFLIAAAPELYEALRDLCESGGLDDGGCVIEKGIAALKKARGEA